MNKKPETIKEYLAWLKDKRGIQLSDRDKTYYESSSESIRKKIIESEYWRMLIDSLDDYNDEYQIDTGYPLLLHKRQPDLYIKPYESLINKSYRKNIIFNENWPESPKGGWILPENWYSSINDIIRTTLIVKYLDGVTFLISKLENICTDYDMPFESQFEAKEEGYYAAHSYQLLSVDIPRITWDTKRIDVYFEIQVTTQLQEVIKKLLHKYYTQKRSEISKPEIEWQWDYSSDEFSTNYLGHILHYIEGMIMEIRQKQEKR